VNRRKLERATTALIEKEGDRCSLCHMAFAHNSRTCGGATSAGVPALVGECCAPRLRLVLTAGVYLTRSYPGLEAGMGSERPCSVEETARAVGAHQKYFAVVDHVEAHIAKKAGLSRRTILHLSDSPWKADDAKWFSANPTRSHRLRPPFPGEFDPPDGPPPDHEFQVLVRQVEPGMRVRGILYHNIRTAIPDVEALIHAIFDVVFAEGRVPGNPISMEEVAELAEWYAGAVRS
jgi:hypothetical protein